MPTNFRLAYNSDGLNYTDLFPKTSTDAIIDANDIYEIIQLQVDVPAPSSQTTTQNISITTTPQMLTSPFRVYLLSTGEQAQSDYGTINQVEIQENSLIITRLYSMPEDSITIELVFLERRGDLNAN